MQNETTQKNRSPIQNVEKVLIGLYFLTFIIVRIGYPVKSILAAILFLITTFGGYFIFRPSKEVRGGKIISIINGVVLGLLFWFELFYFFSVFLIFERALLLFAAFSLAIILLVSILYFLNKRILENRPYIKRVAVRNLIPLLLLLIPILLPNKTRVLIFQGDESAEYYEILQDEYITEAYSKLDKGENDGAIKSALASINCSHVREGVSGYLYRASLNVLGYCYYRSNKYQLADSVLNKALLIATPNDLDEGREYKITLRYMAFNYSSWGYYAKSDSLSNKALTEEKNSEKRIYLQETMANNAGKQGNFSKADSLYKVVLANYVALGIPDPDSFINAHCNLAANCIDINKFDQADSLYQVSLKLVSKYFASEKDIWFSNIYKALSDLYFRVAKYNQAKDMCIKSIELQKKLTGTESKAYLLRLTTLIRIKMALSDYKDVENTLTEILRITDEKYGSSSPNISTVCLMLAQLYCDYSDYPRAFNYGKHFK